ncbi:MAG: response regulator [Pseudomonadota bacterium]|nr:response regulator [Pseudomonadota bacterium]
MLTAEQQEAFSEILCGAREEFTLAYEDDGDHSESCAEQIENLAFAVEIAEIKGLDLVCAEMSQSITDFTDKQQLLKLVDWSSQVLAFIRDPANPELADNLVQFVPESQRETCLQSLLPRSAQAELAGSTQQEPAKPQLALAAMQPEPQPEQQDLLLAELAPLRDKLGKIVDQIFGAACADALDVLKQRYCDTVVCLADTARILSLQGLEALCEVVISNAQQLSMSWIMQNRGPGYLVFQQWPGLVLTYLSDPANDENCLALINHFELKGWPIPVNEDGARALLESLLASGFIEDYFSPNKTAFTAKPEDMELAPVAELIPELFDAFLQDAPGQTAELSACIHGLNAGVQDLALVQQAQRLTHTIKGAANVTGLVAVANMAHVLEDIFEQLCKPNKAADADLLALLQASADCLEALVDYLQGKDDLPEDRLHLYQQLVAYLNQSQVPKASNDAHMEVAFAPEYAPANAPRAATPAASTTETPDDADATEAEDSSPGEDAPLQHHQVETVRVPVSVISSLFRLAEEITIALGSSQEQTQRILKQLDAVNQQDWRVQEQRFELENVVDVRSVARRQRRLGEQQGADFDSLEMDQYDEIYDVAHALIESVADARELNLGIGEEIKTLDALLLQQTRLNKELQRLVKNTRMIPVRSVVPRLQRCIRHAARVTGKIIEFDVQGVETEINEEILDKLIDPIMHLLRNAVDHGIEDGQHRVQQQKPAAGTVQLSFGQDGQNIRIHCDDDGAGIDEEKIRHKALQLGLIQDSDVLGSQQIRQLILKSGFSTKDSANQVSGRGIGMDAVYKRIRELGGQLHILPRASGGTRFEILVPLQLVASNALLVQIQQQWFAIPTRQLDQILAPGSAQPATLGETPALAYEDALYPCHHLGDLLGLRRPPETSPRPVLLTAIAAEPTALYVDALIANQELVIKSTGDYVRNVPGVAGVSILGDGRLVPVLDLPALLERIQTNPGWRPLELPEGTEEHTTDVGNRVLIVDDSLSVRKSLSQLVNDAGYQYDLARDGLEAWEKIQQHPPAVILADMEMPRMNGIELASRVRDNAATRHIPIMMITSRSMQKHRQAAEKAGVSQYFTKPFVEAELLDHIQRCVATGTQVAP